MNEKKAREEAMGLIIPVNIVNLLQKRDNTETEEVELQLKKT